MKEWSQKEMHHERSNMVTPNDGAPHRIITPAEMSAQSATKRVKDILDKTFQSYFLVVADQRIPYGEAVDRPGIWTQVLSSIMSQNPGLRHAVIMACLKADRAAIETIRAQMEAQKEEAQKESDSA